MRNSSGNPSGDTFTTARGKLLCIAAPKAANAKELSLLSTKSTNIKIKSQYVKHTTLTN